jgi:hypothetical protein
MKALSPHRLRGLLCALALALAAAPAVAQTLDNKGRDFLMAFLPNYVGAGTIQLHLTGDVATDVTVEYPAVNPTFSQTVAIVPGSVTIVTLPGTAASSWTSDTVSTNTVRASAAQEFVAYMMNVQSATSDAALALPIDALNTEYIVLDWPTSDGEFAVFAAFDDTNVTITLSSAFGSRPAGIPFTIQLDRGQGYFASSATFSGTRISADRPVGLSNGNRCTNIVRGACDHIFEVAPPLQTWGMSIPVANLPGRPLGSIYRIVASADGTTVSQDGVALAPVLNRGQILQTPELPGSHVFSANAPIFVGQFMTGSPTGSQTDGDPAMGNMVPSDQYQSRYTFATLSQVQFPLQFLTVIADTRDVATITLDGTPIGAQAFAAIGSSGFSWAQLALAAGTHTTLSTRPHGITVEGFGFYDSYLYPGGAQIAFINPVGDADPPLCTLDEVEPDAFAGTARDDRPSEDTNGNGELDEGEDTNGNGEIDEDTGIFSVELLEGAQNLLLSVDEFVPGDGVVGFGLTPIDPLLDYSGIVRVSDGAGNLCERSLGLDFPSMEFDDWGEDVELRISYGPDEEEIRTAYVAVQNRGVQILDVSDPSAIETLGSYDPDTCPNGSGTALFFADDVELLEDLSALFVAAGRCGVLVLDVSDPALPTLLGRYDTPVWAEAVALDTSGENVIGHIADHNGGLVSVDFTPVFDSPAGAPIRLGGVGSSTAGWGSGAAIDVALHEDAERGMLAFVAASQGLRIVDVSSPTAPVLIGGLDTDPGGSPPEVPQDVTLTDDGQVALLGGWQAGLLAVDVSDPTEPTRLDGIATTLAFYETEIMDGWVLATEGQLGLRTFELGEGGLASIEDEEPIPLAGGDGWAWDVEVVGNTAYVTWGILETGAGGLSIIELASSVSRTAAPTPPDLDADGIADTADNCRESANPSQADVNLDGFGDACDADYDGNGVVGISDLGILFAAFGSQNGDPNWNAAVDHDGNGTIGIADWGRLSASWGTPPGPSGLACAGSVPCPTP